MPARRKTVRSVPSFCSLSPVDSSCFLIRAIFRNKSHIQKQNGRNPEGEDQKNASVPDTVDGSQQPEGVSELFHIKKWGEKYLKTLFRVRTMVDNMFETRPTTQVPNKMPKNRIRCSSFETKTCRNSVLIFGKQIQSGCVAFHLSQHTPKLSQAEQGKDYSTKGGLSFCERESRY